jgi:hypothetical protein
MLAEALAAVAVGVVALWMVLRPLTRPERENPTFEEPEDPEETARGVALAALKEIEFDRETGKLSDSDYEALKAKYTAAALEALREEPEKKERASESEDIEVMIATRVQALRFAATSIPSDSADRLQVNGSAPPLMAPRVCRSCGPRPEPDAVFCSSCGRELGAESKLQPILQPSRDTSPP